MGQFIKPATFIFQVGICTVLVVFGVFLLAMNRSVWESTLQKTLDIPDLEVGVASFVIVKVFGLGCVTAGLILSWFMLIAPLVTSG